MFVHQIQQDFIVRHAHSVKVWNLWLRSKCFRVNMSVVKRHLRLKVIHFRQNVSDWEACWKKASMKVHLGLSQHVNAAAAEPSVCVFTCRSGCGIGPWRLWKPRLLLALHIWHAHMELRWTHSHGGLSESLFTPLWSIGVFFFTKQGLFIIVSTCDSRMNQCKSNTKDSRAANTLTHGDLIIAAVVFTENTPVTAQLIHPQTACLLTLMTDISHNTVTDRWMCYLLVPCPDGWFDTVPTDEHLPVHTFVQSVLLTEAPQHGEEAASSVSVMALLLSMNTSTAYMLCHHKVISQEHIKFGVFQLSVQTCKTGSKAVYRISTIKSGNNLTSDQTLNSQHVSVLLISFFLLWK